MLKKLKKLLFDRFIPVVGAFCKNNNEYINVIYYHDIVNGNGYGSQKTNIELFKNQMQYIKNNGYKTFTFNELDSEDNIKYDKKSVLITFDDGWRSNYTEIFSFMKEIGIKYNIYLEVGNIDQNEEYLTWDMVREMYNSGMVGFGAHTYSHPDMSDISNINPTKEFDEANKRIMDETGITPKDFCYPFGKWSDKSNEYILENTCYTRIYTSNMLYSYQQNGKIIFGRNSINGDRPFSVFKNMLKGNYNIFDTLRR